MANVRIHGTTGEAPIVRFARHENWGIFKCDKWGELPCQSQ